MPTVHDNNVRNQHGAGYLEFYPDEKEYGPKELKRRYYPEPIDKDNLNKKDAGSGLSDKQKMTKYRLYVEVKEKNLPIDYPVQNSEPKDYYLVKKTDANSAEFDEQGCHLITVYEV